MPSWLQRILDYFKTPSGKKVLRVTSGVFVVAVFAWLIWQLTTVGWGEVVQHIPTNPLFYVLFLLLYAQLPLTEVLIYRLLWTFNAWSSVPAFFKKRIYNRDVMGYSGEVYFFAWAREKVGLPKREIAEAVRDNNIISSVASTFMAAVLVGFFLVEGEFNILEWIGYSDWKAYLGWTLLAIAVLFPIAYRFRKYLFTMPARTSLQIFGLQCARLLLGQVIQIALWAVAIPEVSIKAWFTMSAMGLILARLPFPQQTVVFAGITVPLASELGIPVAAWSGVMVVVIALERIAALLVFALAHWGEKKNGE